MDTTSTAYRHVALDESGTARIAGTRSRVIDVAMDRTEFGYSPEETWRQHPHLTLGQVHSALAYYFDHKQELDAEIERRKDEADALRRDLEDPDLQKRLRKETEEHQPSPSSSDE